MRIPGSIGSLYDAELATIKSVQKFAQPRMRLLCHENEWLFDDRIKSRESLLSKLELKSGPLDQIVDFYAAMVIVPVQAQLDDAVSALQSLFDGEIKASRINSANQFAYDDLHFIAKLGTKVSPAVAVEGVRHRAFEIQVRTGLQYAWWRATHDQVYKSGSTQQPWQVERASGQAKASLELLDATINDLTLAGAMQWRQVESTPNEDWIVAYLTLWPQARRPDDVLRFARSSKRVLEISDVTIQDVLRLAATDKYVALRQRADLTPYNVLVLACSEVRNFALDQVFRDADILVTPEMATADDTLTPST